MVITGNFATSEFESGGISKAIYAKMIKFNKFLSEFQGENFERFLLDGID